jgi:alpha-glucosidase
MAALYLTLRGSAIMYYGEEIGMENNDPKRKEDVEDPEGKLGWPLEIGRDGERTPMQWDHSANAGFSKAKPWLPVPLSAHTHNVADEINDPDSVLSFYRKLLAMRHTETALLDGDYVSLNEGNPNVLTYVRRYKGEAILVILNMSAAEQKVPFELSGAGFLAPKVEVLLTSFHKPLKGMFAELPMEPYSVFIARVTK